MAEARGDVLETVVAFLELALVGVEPLELAPNLRVERAGDLTPPIYRGLVGRVGLRWHWVDVVRADDTALTRRLADPARSVFRLIADGNAVGFFELCDLNNGTLELAYLGLESEAIGQGFGRALLQSAIATACRITGALRLVARTCRLDHPAALPLYLQCGFRISGYQHDSVLPLTEAEIAQLTL